MAIKTIQDLNPEDVKKAIAASSVEEVNKRLTAAGVVGAKSPTGTGTIKQAPEGFEPIDTQTGAPVVAETTPIVEPTKVVEPTPVIKEEPIVTEPINTIAKGEIPGVTAAPITKTEADKVADVAQITNIAQFKAAGGTIDNLSNLIEYAYGKDGAVTIKGDAIYGTKNGVPTKWTIDEAGNPIATSITRDVARSEGVDMGNNLPSSEVFSNLMLGTTEGLDVTTPEYSVAKSSFDNYNKLVKTESGIYNALKSNTLDKTILAELNKNPTYAAYITAANERIAKENVDDATVKSILEMSQGELVDYIKNIMGELGLNKDFQKQLDDNKTIQESKSNYEKANRVYLENKNKMDSLKNKIKAENPNASPALLNALYNRQAQPLIDNQNQALTDMGVAKGSYDLEFGEMDYVSKLEIAQSDKQIAVYNNLFSAQYDNFVDEREFGQALETIKTNARLAGEYAFQNVGSGVIIRTNKVTGKYEFLDVNNVPAGEKIDVANGGIMDENGYSMSGLEDKYPNEASIKNDNPAGISLNQSGKMSQNLANILEEAGIEWEIGSARPEDEGGYYVKFENAQEGLKAHKAILAEASYDNVYKRLMQWVGTNNPETNKEYALDLMGKAGINLYGNDANFSTLSEDKLNKLLSAQIQRESPGFFKEATKAGILKADGTIDYEAGKTSGPNTTTEEINGTQVILGGLGVPVDYERTIKSQINTQLLNSEVELKAANEVIQKMYNAGITDPGDASAMFQGFKINSVDDLEFGGAILKYSRGLTEKSEGLLANIAQSVNSGNYGGAALLLEDNYYKNIKAIEGEDLYTRNRAQEDINRINDLKNFIEKMGNSYPGIIGGTFENLILKLKDSDVATLKGKMARLNTAEKVELFGVAQTEAESGSFDPLEFLINDKVDTLTGKISNKENDILIRLNAYRNGRMPDLSAEQLNSGIEGVVEAYGNAFNQKEDAATAVSFTDSQTGATFSEEQAFANVQRLIDAGTITQAQGEDWLERSFNK